MIENCAACFFYRGTDCHVNGPVNVATMPLWPKLIPDDWCALFDTVGAHIAKFGFVSNGFVPPNLLLLGTIAASTDGKIVYISDADQNIGGYISQSLDYGVTWTTLYNPGLLNAWQSVACSSDGTKVAALAAFGQGIWISANTGVTWTNYAISDSQFPGGLAMSSDGTKLLVSDATTHKVYNSVDGGATWASVLSVTYPDTHLLISDDGATMIVGEGYLSPGQFAKIQKSTDTGVTWTELPVVGGARAMTSLCGSTDCSVLYAVINHGGGLWKSIDAGVTWSSVTIPPTINAFDYQSASCSADGLVVLLTLSDSDPPWFSISGGTGWAPVDLPEVGLDANNLLQAYTPGCVTKTGHVMFCAEQAGGTAFDSLFVLTSTK